ncbi:DUF2628 domain-containing protein [Maridesulfovibrio sp. FT414]|uniref:DUF2628 domain-containing protein n=1 Tax=Maridesulfovibrio sp. FT414 TaxID=2979469 RepID=UPI003D8059B4
METKIEYRDYYAFMGENAAKYYQRFEKFELLGGGFAATWHWPAFFVGPLWFMYRKMYVWALVSFLFSWVPYAAFPAMIASGLCAHYLYYRECRVKILGIKNYADPDRLGILLQRQGGVNKWVIAAAVVYLIIGTVFVMKSAGLVSG